LLGVIASKIMNFWENTCNMWRFFDNMEAEEAIMGDREGQEAI
jgi:hypothetical protein